MWDLISRIPGWLVAAIGAVANVTYGAYKYSKKPFEQDFKRFNAIIEAIDPFAIESFQNIDIRYFSSSEADSLFKAKGELDLIDKFERICMDAKLKEKEFALAKALDEITTFIAWNSFYRRGSTTARTFLWDSFDENDAQDQKKAQKIKETTNKLGKNLWATYLAYKAYGDKKFARKIE